MPNGFMGSHAEWREMEAPYVRIDPILRAFAQRHALAVMKNYRDADRSLRFNDSLHRTIWVTLGGTSGDAATYEVSVLAFQDRPERYTKGQRVASQVAMPQLDAALERALEVASSWTAEDLEPLPEPRPKGVHPGSVPPTMISRSADGTPDLPEYTEPMEYYRQMYADFLAAAGGPASGRDSPLAARRRHHGERGLIARGVESIPYVLGLLKHSNPEVREDAARILDGIAPGPGAENALRGILVDERDPVVRAAIEHSLAEVPRVWAAIKRIWEELSRRSEP